MAATAFHTYNESAALLYLIGTLVMVGLFVLCIATLRRWGRAPPVVAEPLLPPRPPTAYNFVVDLPR